ncbi:hypothetical protein SAMN05661091_2704 [Paenibacillus uliginis N3/975]|uniref:Uncharacterized protein n=1 Tax=Paenibacillus uliginis N3/975 TaxID=1313296 RepID=A0A1X7HFT9_9BACL|nr:hypothetical protein SAMN05661091_2704 [Paenibacillus uliginis N3/975]
MGSPSMINSGVTLDSAVVVLVRCGHSALLSETGLKSGLQSHSRAQCLSFSGVLY